jgi:RNA polymerase sigma factor (sigma-70 family)
VEQKTDTELVVSARLGDRKAFDRLVTRYQPLAQRVARGMIDNEEIARDLAQEAMLQAYLSLGQLREDSRFKSWLTGIVLNVCRNYLRDQKAERLSFETLTGGLQLDAANFSGVAMDPQAAAEERERHQQVLEAFNSLSPADRYAALLFYNEQLSLKEVAAAAGVTVAAVKNRLYRARKQLRERLLPVYPDLDRAIQGAQRRRMMIKATVAGVFEEERPEGRTAAVVLQDETGRRTLRIRMAPSDAGEIDLGLRHLSLPRPMTFSFMAGVLEAAGARLEEVRIEALKDDVFYAVAKLRRGKTVRELDARPSDALALAVHTGSPIYVAEEIMGQAGTDLPEVLRQAQPFMPEKTAIPEFIPLMPLRDGVYFPHAIFPIFVGRTRSMRVLDEAQARGRYIFLVTQKDGRADDPQSEDVYHVGIVARLIETLHLPDGTARIMMEGAARGRVLEYLQTEPFHLVRVEVLPELEDRSDEVEALIQRVKAQFQQLVEQGKKIPDEVLTHLAQIDEPGRLADAIAAHLKLPVESQQQILETVAPRERLEKLRDFLVLANP